MSFLVEILFLLLFSTFTQMIYYLFSVIQREGKLCVSVCERKREANTHIYTVQFGLCIVREERKSEEEI